MQFVTFAADAEMTTGALHPSGVYERDRSGNVDGGGVLPYAMPMPFHVPGIATPQPVDPLCTYAVHEDGTPVKALLDKVGASPLKLMDDNNEQF